MTGREVGCTVGDIVGVSVGEYVGGTDGGTVGEDVGRTVGSFVSPGREGFAVVGYCDGRLVDGFAVGLGVGCRVGTGKVGCAEGC